MSHPKSDTCDITLLLEGTFPYVSGGVSSWVNQIIRAYPEYRFGLIFLGSRREDYSKFRYELPENVVHFEEHFLYDGLNDNNRPKGHEGDPEAFKIVNDLHLSFKADNADVALQSFRKIASQMLPKGKLTADDFLRSRMAWDLICQRYNESCNDPSFVDYFWTVRMMHAPLWKLASIVSTAPKSRVFHTISTGYAGFLGALLKNTLGTPLILSEHGIYTKERKIDLFKSEWIKDSRNLFQRDSSELSYFRQMWIRFFEWLGRFCYDASDQIIALYEQNRLRQVADGASDERSFNIPNGINLPRFAPLRDQRPEDDPPLVLCLIGRVVPIKDIKTFIRAMRYVANRLPTAEGWIAGPEDEDPAYAEECKALVISLGLQENIKFLGFQRVDALMPKIGLTILSSISEALPLVILEGYAAGVPTVSTEVGSCRQLVEGLTDEDKAIGPSGAIVDIADPEALANASLDLLTNKARWKAASNAAIARVERFYDDRIMFGSYKKVYETALAQSSES
ncbi:GT4 family glycosyltransferase PelF [Azonexus hydrophilus]|uniref:GT4 family glycosyltransferase PelF n=1 Tax=Azonexus hydrophilus TaxID=418702 RepID=A0ABZ2XQB7_9RHOO